MTMLSAAEAAKLLHLHVKRVQGLARQGRLPAVRVGRKWLFPVAEIERMLRPGARSGAAREPAGPEIELSARNRLRGTVTSLHADGLMAELRLDVGGQEIVAIITRSSAERLGLAPGVEACAVIKATEVMIGREDPRR